MWANWRTRAEGAGSFGRKLCLGKKRGKIPTVNPMPWLLVAPLAPGLIGCLWALSRERDLRLALVAGFLVALVGRQFLATPAEAVDLTQVALGSQLRPLLVDFGTNLLASLAAVAITRSIVERNRAEQALWDTMEAFRALGTFFNRPHQELERSLDELLSLGCKHLRLEIGLLSRVEGDHYDIVALRGPDTLSLAVGDRLALSDTLCSQVMERNQLVAIESTAASRWRQYTASTALGSAFCSYLGMPVCAGDRQLGTLCFADSQARTRRFGSTEKQLLELMAHWVAGALAERDARQGLDVFARRQQSSLELSRSALEPQPNRLTDSLERIASALDAPFAVVLRKQASRSQSEADIGLVVSAGVGWRDGTIGSTVADGTSCFGPALLRRESVAVEDFANGGEPTPPAFYAAHGIVATACVPIARADQPVGVLAVGAANTRIFRADELDFLQLSANLLASSWSGQPAGDPVAVDRSRAPNSRRQTSATRRRGATDRRRVRVDQSVAELEESLRNAAGTGVELVLDLAAAASEVRMFGYEFERILWSLVFQASELARGDGELRIETRRLASNGAGATRSSFVTLSVRATNAQLDDDAMSSLLDCDDVKGLPPSAGNTTPVRRLSLPRIRRLLHAVGGDLSSHSGEDDGTTFTSYLPALPLPSADSAVGKPPPPGTHFAKL